MGNSRVKCNVTYTPKHKVQISIFYWVHLRLDNALPSRYVWGVRCNGHHAVQLRDPLPPLTEVRSV